MKRIIQNLNTYKLELAFIQQVADVNVYLRDTPFEAVYNCETYTGLTVSNKADLVGDSTLDVFFGDDNSYVITFTDSTGPQGCDDFVVIGESQFMPTATLIAHIAQRTL